MKKSVFENIQALRAVAAFLVVWVHLVEILGGAELPSILHSIGFMGVDLFFVISGFIMVVTNRKQAEPGISPAGTFMLHRIVRIVPLYYFFTILVFSISLISPSLLKSTTPDLPQLFKSMAFLPFLKSEGRIYPTYYLGWSLNYEMLFYLIFSISMCFSSRAKVIVAILIMAVGFALSQLYLNGAAPQTQSEIIIYTFGRPIIFDFMAGMIIGYASAHVEMSESSFRTLGAVLVAFGLVGVWALSGTNFLNETHPIAPPTDTFLCFGVPSSLLVAGAVLLEKGQVIAPRLLVLLGNASYSIYLSHYLIVGAIGAVLNRMNAGYSLRLVIAACAFPVLGYVGIVLYRRFEDPVQRRLRTMLGAIAAPSSPKPQFDQTR